MCLDENGEVVDGINCDEKIRPSCMYDYVCGISIFMYNAHILTALASCGGGRCFAGFWKALEFSDVCVIITGYTVYATMHAKCSAQKLVGME